MSLRLATTAASLAVGSASASAAYLGTTQVWSAVPTFSPLGYTRLWGLTAKNGTVSGTAAADTGTFAVKWWDGTIQAYNNGDTFSDAGSGLRAFEIYPTANVTANTVGSSGALLGLAAISTTQSKFGGASARFANAGDLIAGNVTFNWNANWTLEFWLYRTGAGFGQVATLFQAGSITGGVAGLHLTTDSGGVFDWNDAASGAINGGLAPLNQWVHVAAVRNNGTNTLYIDGASVGTSTQTFPVGNTGFTIGGVASYGFYTDGYIDDFRLTQSVVYSGTSFTPPTAALTAISGTAILFPFNSSAVAPSGQFDAFDVSGNELTTLRAESVSLASAPGYYQYGYQTGTYPYFNYVPGQYVPGAMEQGNLATNTLNAAALDQFYTDLLSGSGALYVAGNPGITGDDPTLATAKGYTVYGSVPP